MSNKILTICVTRNRPELCQRMLKSFMATKSPGTDIIFSLDDDEPRYDEYKNLFSINQVNFFTLLPCSVTEHINLIMANFPNYDYYHITNDDVEYKTENWGEILTQGRKGIFYGNDLFQGENLPTFPIISVEICDALGWLQCRYLKKYFGDTVWAEIGSKCGCLYYNKDVIIEHHHPLAGKREEDNPLYEMEYKNDRINFTLWVVGDSLSDKRKVMKCIKSIVQ